MDVLFKDRALKPQKDLEGEHQKRYLEDQRDGDGTA